MLAKILNLFSLLSLSVSGYSLTNTYVHTQAYTLLTMQSDRTVVLHLSMLFMRKQIHEWWVLRQKCPCQNLEEIHPTHLLKKVNKYTDNKSQLNIQGIKLMANCCIWTSGLVLPYARIFMQLSFLDAQCRFIWKMSRKVWILKTVQLFSLFIFD